MSLLDDLKKRAEAVDAACRRSNQMERDFLEKKVLNREANEALEDFGRRRGQFGEYLLQRSDEIIAALEAVRPEEGRPQLPPEIRVALRVVLNHVDPGFENCTKILSAWLDGRLEQFEPQDG